MGLLTKLKSILGIDSNDGRRGGSVDVTVEREPTAERERAVKESVEEEPSEEESSDEAQSDEPVAEETDAAASTESLVEDHVEDDEKVAESERAEPAEVGAGQPEAEDETTDIEEVEPDTDAGEEPDEEGQEDVELLKGIGPAYAERLHDAGIETVADLTDADADELGDEIDVSPSRVQRWIDRAQERLS